MNQYGITVVTLLRSAMPLLAHKSWRLAAIVVVGMSAGCRSDTKAATTDATSDANSDANSDAKSDANSADSSGASDGGLTDAGAAADIGNAFCTDDNKGSGTLAMPKASGDNTFTATLLACSLSTAEVAICYGASHSSKETLTATKRKLTSNAIPNHDADLFPNEGNPNAVSAQKKSYIVPLAPKRNAKSAWANIIGYALNGIKLEPETAERYKDGQWKYEALTWAGRMTADTLKKPGASLGLDCNFAHVQPNGEYHYHGAPTGLGDVGTGFSLGGGGGGGKPPGGKPPGG